MIKLKSWIQPVFVTVVFLLIAVSVKDSQSQQAYYTKFDSVGATSLMTEGDTLASYRTGKYVTWMGVTIPGTSVGDTLRARGKWYGKTDAYKTLSWRNTKNGTVDSIMYIGSTVGVPHTYELVDPNIDEVVIDKVNYAVKKTYVYFRFRK